LSTASASGCSENFSTAAAVDSNCASVTPGAGTISTTSGWPSVSVPVLSKTTTVSLVAFSSAAAFLNRMPFIAPRPVPTMIAIGVASPSASGQAMTKTVMVSVRANSSGWPRTQNHTAKVASPTTMAMSTSHCEAWSASNWPGAFEFCASCTSLTICASAVSAPTLVAW
jgi:hypothetical protein